MTTLNERPCHTCGTIIDLAIPGGEVVTREDFLPNIPGARGGPPKFWFCSAACVIQYDTQQVIEQTRRLLIRDRQQPATKGDVYRVLDEIRDLSAAVHKLTHTTTAALAHTIATEQRGALDKLAPFDGPVEGNDVRHDR